MKISLKKIVGYCFAFVILVDMHFLYLVKYPVILENLLHRRIVPGLLALLFFVFFQYSYSRLFKKKYGFLNGFSWYVICLFLIFFAYTILKYKEQGIKTTIISSSSMLIILWAIVLVVKWGNVRGFHRFARGLNWLMLIWFSILIVQCLVYRSNGSVIFDFATYFSGNVATRNNQIRISLGGLANAMLVYNFDIIFMKRTEKKGLPLIVFLLGVYGLLFIQQTRMYMLAFAVGVMCSLLIGGKTQKSKIFYMIILVLAVAIILSTNYVSVFISSFSINGVWGGSTEIRLGELVYYWDVFKEKPMIGLGALSDAVTGPYANLMHASHGHFFIDDIGYFGTLANGGILLISIVVVFFGRMAYVVNLIRKRKCVHMYSFFIAIIAYLFISGWTLTHYLTQKASLIIPICLALSELIIQEINEKETTEATL